MILVAHPFGNANVRAVLAALQGERMLARYFTTLGWPLDGAAALLPGALNRRGYDLPNEKMRAYPWREFVRLLAGNLGVRKLIEHERGWASVDRVWQELDTRAAAFLCANKRREQISAVYAYEDCALHLFEAADDLRVRRIYDLPIAYWETAQRLLREEAQRYPEWESTLVGTRDSAAKVERKTRELELAEMVVCPSDFVLESLPQSARSSKRCVVVPFGSPVVKHPAGQKSTKRGRLRVLFAGAMTQRKGLADLFAAIKLVDSREVEFVVMGSPLMPLEWYRARAEFTYEPPRPHAEVLRLMSSCDVFVLPSIVEGRALVQQEAMACGLPLIATKNAGGADLIAEGETGFLVPIRSPAALAERIGWCAANRASISGMGIAAQRRAAELSWRGYGEKVVAAIRSLTGE
ncbi:MAG TPA: glycosyltransferase [Chthoniobacterales bacterium]